MWDSFIDLYVHSKKKEGAQRDVRDVIEIGIVNEEIKQKAKGEQKTRNAEKGFWCVIDKSVQGRVNFVLLVKFTCQ